MRLDSLLAAVAHKPAVTITVVVLALAVVATLVLSFKIKRRRVVAAVTELVDARIESNRIQRATSARLPDDMQQRLRYLTADFDTPPSESPEPAAAQAPLIFPTAPRQPLNQAAQPTLDDATHFFGAELDADTARGAFDSTMRFHGDIADAEDDDATRFFGSDLDEPAPDVAAVVRQPVEQQAQPDVAAEAVSGTRFFGLDDDVAPAPVATQYFSAEELSAESSIPSGTQFFSPQELGVEQAPTTTAYFPTEELALDDAPNATHLFAPEELDDSTASQTRFFGPEDEDDEYDAAAHAMEGATGMLHALPPMSAVEPDDDRDSVDAAATLERSTGPLPALPPSSQPVGHATLELVREQLAAAEAPEVLALSLIDGSGRVLAGETDEDLTGELRTLMAESGQGNEADVDQPVRLGDDSDGALLLVPTGANALLGALVREAGDADGTRSRLRGLARNIGETLRRAS